MALAYDFNTIYDSYGEMLFKIAYLYLGSTEDAEDVLQEVFIKLLSKTSEFSDNEHLKAWLIRTTQNKCKDILRGPARKNVGIDDIPLSCDSDDVDKRLDVICKIIALPPKYKTVIILYYYYDYSVRKIAETLKISNASVKMRLKRGREKLKLELEEYNYETK